MYVYFVFVMWYALHSIEKRVPSVSCLFVVFVIQIFSSHASLLCRGFALAHPPTIHQALEGNLPLSTQSNERSFLRDFVMCAPGTSGGRLAR